MCYEESNYVAPDADLIALVGRIDVILDEEYKGSNVEERCRVVMHTIRLMNALKWSSSTPEEDAMVRDRWRRLREALNKQQIESCETVE